VLEVHHLYGSAVAACDFGGQGLSEDGEIVASGRADMRGKVGIVFARLWSK